jgi:hypothetical protein
VHTTGRSIPGLGDPVQIEQQGNRVDLRTRKGHGGGGEVEYEVEVPPDCSVEIHTAKADVTVHGIQAPVRVQTVSGDVMARDVIGECELRTVGGDIEAFVIAGRLVTSSTNGDVSVSGAHLSAFTGESTNGDFEIATSLEQGGVYTFKTVNGDVRLDIPGDAGANVAFHTLNGEVHSDFPVQWLRQSRRDWQGRIGDGSAEIRMESLNGELYLGDSGDVTVRPPGTSQSTAAATAVEVPGEEHTEAPAAPGMSADLERSTGPQAEAEIEPMSSEGPSSRGAQEDVDSNTATPLRAVPTDVGYATPTPATVDTDVEAGDGEPDAQEDAAAILAMLERGEITVDEAMERLDALA